MRPVPVATMMAPRNAARPQRRNGSNSTSPTLGNVLAAAAGGIVGAGMAGMLFRAGLNPYLAGGVTTASGVAVATLASGRVRWFGAGVAASGAGQVAMTFLSRRTQQQTIQQQPGADLRRPQAQGLSPAHVLEAFHQARNAAAQSAEALQAQQYADAQQAAHQAAAHQVAQMQAQMRQAADHEAAARNAAAAQAAPAQVAA